MPTKDNEEEELRTVALQNAQSILVARRRAEEALRKQSEWLRVTLASIGDAVISTDAEGRVTFMNVVAEALTGWPSAEAFGHPLPEVFHLVNEQTLEAVDNPALRALREGAVVGLANHTVLIARDGSQRPIDDSAAPIRDDQGEIVGVVLVFRDVAARKEVEEALRGSEEFNRSILESSPDCIKVLDLQGRLMLINPPCLCLMEAEDSAAFLGREWGELWPEESRPLVRQAMAEASLGGTNRFQAFRPTAKGTPKWWDVIVAPVHDAGGRVARLVATSRDITERKAIEADRERLLVHEQKAREIAEAASRAKDEFLATVSHELRTPLNAILGWARLLSGGKLDDQMEARGLKAIEQNARAQAQLIEDLLDVSRIISGKFRLNNQPTQIARTIEAAIDSVRPTAEAKGVRLQVVLDPGAGPVSGDAGRLQQVVWNLLSNAVKFTPRGGQVQVRLMPIDSHIELIVTDTGQGIGPELLPRVFDRFWQADGSSTRTHGGLGLGLALVRHIIELHGGSVAADSPGQDKGATFTVRLPLMVIHAKPSDNERVHPRVSGDGALHFDSSLSLEAVKVLVVDDEPETLLLLSTVLTRCGAYVKTASSAEEGFREVKRWLPDVIVSDIGMPGEDGYSFIARVKTWMRETGTWIPAMALTAYARAEDRMKALASGYQIHVAKPVEPAELVAVLVSLVERPTTPWAAGR
jgi:PAS domain S-box-containing protein